MPTSSAWIVRDPIWARSFSISALLGPPIRDADSAAFAPRLRDTYDQFHKQLKIHILMRDHSQSQYFTVLRGAAAGNR